VIIPVHNGAKYLAQAIESVLAQELAAHEIIVVDDGSTDQSAAIAGGFGNPVRVFRQTKHGPGAARNAGVRAATGAYLAFLDADDLWAPAKLARQMAAFETIPGLDVVFTHVRNFHSPDLTAAQRERISCPPEAMPGMIPSTLLLHTASFIPFAENLAVGELIPWLGRVKDLNLKVHLLPEVLVSRRLHETNLGRSARDRRRDYLVAVKEVFDRRRKPGGES
jgi:glycosyltransferase involved in cell wall biosynthesis